MHPEPTSEQAELKAAARDFLAREVTPERLLAWESDAVGVSPEVRRAVAELGWIGIGAPAAAGGSGAPLVDVACLLEECARGLLPLPLVGQIRAAAALADVSPTSRTLAAAVRGDVSLALAFDEEAASGPGMPATAVRSEGGRTTVHGEKAYVADGDGADVHLVAAQEGSGAPVSKHGRSGASAAAARRTSGTPGRPSSSASSGPAREPPRSRSSGGVRWRSPSRRWSAGSVRSST
jgi:alkylation response protein AidB-like acyl-CoA dehydrogenase